MFFIPEVEKGDYSLSDLQSFESMYGKQSEDKTEEETEKKGQDYSLVTPGPREQWNDVTGPTEKWNDVTK